MTTLTFKINAKTMLQHVTAAAAAIDTRAKDAMIILRLKGSVIFVEGFCYDFSVSGFIPVSTDCPDFVWYVDYKTLLNLCKYAKKEEIVFTANTENVSLSASLNGNAFDIRAIVCDKIQRMGGKEGGNVALNYCFANNAKNNELINAIDSVSYAAAKKDIRRFLCGVNFRSKDGDVKICATDGHRLAERPLFNAPALSDFNVTLHNSIISLLLKQAKKASIELVVYANGIVVIDYGSTKIVADTGEMGNFPDVERVKQPLQIARQFMQIDKQEVMNAVNLLLISSKSKFAGARLDADADNWVLSLTCGDVVLKIPARFNDVSNGKIGGVNLLYLKDMLTACQEDVVKIYWDSKAGAVCFFVVESGQIRDILMSCKVD